MTHRGASSFWDFQSAEATQSQDRDADRTVSLMLIISAAGLWVLLWGRCRGLEEVSREEVWESLAPGFF